MASSFNNHENKVGDMTANDILHAKGLLDPDQNNILHEAHEQGEKLKWEEKHAKEKEEWDAVERLTNPVSGIVTAIEDISFSEALQHFQTQTFNFSNTLQVFQKSLFTRLLQFIFGKRHLNKNLEEERELVFNITQVAYSDEDKIHCRVLQTIYKRLTKSNHNCPRFGSHWEVIGFQGNDPATDLRGAGFLALLHLLFLVTEHPSVASEMYKLSLHPKQNFPFCLLSINVTRIALQALRQDKLTNPCNKRKQVVGVMNEFYLAVFWHIYEIWKKGFKTMNDSGHVLKDAEEYALKNPTVLLKNITSAIEHSHRRNIPQPITIGRLSTSSTVSDSSLQSPVMASHSLNAVLQPYGQETYISRSSDDPQFAGVLELANDEITS